MNSLTTGYVFNPNGIVSSPPGTLSQISEEILSPEPVKSQLSPFEASTDSPSATTSAPAKRKSIVDFFSPKAAGQKLKEAISHLPDSETMSPKSVIDDNDQERLKIEEENCTLLINLTRAGNINSHPAYEVYYSTPCYLSPHLLVGNSLM